MVAAGVAAVAAVAALQFPPPPAVAADPPPEVTSTGAQVRIAAERRGGTLHESARISGYLRDETWKCEDDLARNPYADAEAGRVGTLLPGFPPDPGRTALKRIWIRCNSSLGRIAEQLGYLYADEVVDFDREARVLAERYLAERVAPVIGIGSAPPGRSLVGIETWFWVEGIDTRPLLEDHAIFSRTLRLRLDVAAVRWDFGDGTTAALGADGLGSPGAPSAAAHRYQVRSTGPDAPGAAYPVLATVELAITYTLDGAGPYTVTPPLRTSASAPLVVREAQAVIG